MTSYFYNIVPRSTSKTHWTMATFSKRHPMIEIGSLDSFSLDENLRRGIPDAPVKPPDFYFEPPRSAKSHFLLVSSAEDERPDPDQVGPQALLRLLFSKTIYFCLNLIIVFIFWLASSLVSGS